MGSAGYNKSAILSLGAGWPRHETDMANVNRLRIIFILAR